MPGLSASVEHVDVVDLKTCERWLAQAQVADPEHACEQLRAVLRGLVKRRPNARARLEVLERLREPIRAATDEHHKRFVGRALPLRTPEADAFTRVVSLFREQWDAYRDLLEISVGGSASVLTKRAHVLASRCLSISSDIALVHYRARHEIPAQMWQDLYRTYRIIERERLETVELPGQADRSGSTCRAFLLRTLLLHTARPYGLASRELEATRRWIRGWSDLVELNGCTSDGEALALDLDGSAPPFHQSVRIDTAPAGLRILSTQGFKRAVQKRIKALKDGVTPQDIGLGRDFAPRDALRLLQHLYNAWFAPPQVRQFTRRSVREWIDVVAGFDAIYQAFEGAAPGDAAPEAPRQPWRLLEDSPAGFRIERPDTGARLNHLQLIAVRPDGAQRYILTETRWLSRSANGAIGAGLQALPGLAHAINVRVAASRDATEEPMQRALLIENASGYPASIVAPRGIFLEGCFIDLIDAAGARRVRLGTVTRRGSDFECITLDALL